MKDFPVAEILIAIGKFQNETNVDFIFEESWRYKCQMEVFMSEEAPSIQKYSYNRLNYPEGFFLLKSSPTLHPKRCQFT